MISGMNQKFFLFFLGGAPYGTSKIPSKVIRVKLVAPMT